MRPRRSAIVEQVDDLAEGRHLILSGKVYGLLMLPLDLQRDAFAGRRPEVVFFYDNQHMTVGGILARGATSAVGEAGAGVRVALRNSQGEPVEIAQAAITPIPIQSNTLFNPALNYAHFLLAALLPAVLQIIVVTTSAYSVGLDIEGRYRLVTLRRLGGGLWPALFGKLVPHTLVFLVIYGLADSILFGYLEMPLRGQRVAPGAGDHALHPRLPAPRHAAGRGHAADGHRAQHRGAASPRRRSVSWASAFRASG